MFSAPGRSSSFWGGWFKNDLLLEWWELGTPTLPKNLFSCFLRRMAVLGQSFCWNEQIKRKTCVASQEDHWMFLTSLCIYSVKICLCQNCDCFLFEASSYTCPHEWCLHWGTGCFCECFLQLILYLPEAAGMSPITTGLSSLNRHRAQQQVCTYMTIHANPKPAVLPCLGTWLEELPPCTIVHQQHGSRTKPGHKKVAAGLPVGS